MEDLTKYPEDCRKCERFATCSVRCGKGVKQWFSVPGEFSNQRYFRYRCPVEEEDRIMGPMRRLQKEVRRVSGDGNQDG